jgi:hypothetical protein
MVQAPQRTALSGPSLIRLLARITQAEVTEPGKPLSDRLSDWVGWTDAITLSTALNGAPVATGPARTPRDDAQASCERVRSSLTHAIAAATRAPSAPARAHATAAEPLPDYADFRQRYQSMQQAMESDIGELRQRLRVLLAATTPGMARLATVDAVMERSLGVRERSLLASGPVLLGAHFERLRNDAQPESAADTPAAAQRAWLRTFLGDMQAVLLAELEIRFQPVEGLLAALPPSR